MRRSWLVLFLVGCSLLISTRAASAQDKQVGGGAGYLFDTRDNWLFVTGMAWIPINGPDNIPFKPIVLSPRFSKFFGFGLWQVDADLLWDIPMAGDSNVRPYIGMGVGIAHESFGGFSDTTPVLNIDVGLRYKKPGWKFEMLLEAKHSSGIDYVDTMVINLCALFPLGRK